VFVVSMLNWTSLRSCQVPGFGMYGVETLGYVTS
jgi:hypothetical protein